MFTFNHTNLSCWYAQLGSLNPGWEWTINSFFFKMGFDFMIVTLKTSFLCAYKKDTLFRSVEKVQM